MTIQYRAIFKKEDSGLIYVSFPDVPEAQTQGRSTADATRNAVDALVTALGFYCDKKLDLPKPSEARICDTLITVPYSAAVKLALLREMRKACISAAELARLMKVSRSTAYRIVCLERSTKIDTLQQAFASLGKTLIFTVS